jgi:hypothetical protein
MTIARRTSVIRAGLAAGVKAATAAVAALNGACAFEPAGGVADAPVTDAPTDAPIGDGPLDSFPVQPFCDASDPDLRLCLTFDDDMTRDQSGGALPMIVDRVDYTPGVVGSAIRLRNNSYVHVPENPALDTSAALTVEMFVEATMAPNTRAGLLDNNAQYGVWLSAAMQPYCSLQTSSVGAVQITTDVWVHVACVFDGAALLLYVDGQLAGQASRTAPIATNGQDGTNVGQDASAAGAADPLTGLIDELRVWAKARTPAEILAAARRRAEPRP